MTCEKCGKNFNSDWRAKSTIRKYKNLPRFCSVGCSNSRIQTNEMNESRRDKLKKEPRSQRLNKKICSLCNKEYLGSYYQNYCKSCLHKIRKESGRKGSIAKKIVKRSKNEIYFYNLCKNKFDNVLHNIKMFNGWDADIILPDYKIAILWNGKWHYEKLAKNHSVKQVQNRDKIKVNEIKKLGYIPYIIKDMGKYNPDFVKEQFNKFLSQGEQVFSLAS